MAALAQHAGIVLAAGIGAAAAVLLAALILARLLRAVLRRTRWASLSRLSATRRGIIGLPQLEAEAAPAEAEAPASESRVDGGEEGEAVGEAGDATVEAFAEPAAMGHTMAELMQFEAEMAPAVTSGTGGEDAEDADEAPPRALTGGDQTSVADSFRHLAMIADLCGRDVLDAQKTLTQLAKLLPAALAPNAAWSCRIEVMDSTYWSPSYVSPSTEFGAELKVGGARVGAIRVGPTGGLATSDIDETRRMLLEAAATLASQMLERRADRFQLEKLHGELDRRKIAVQQSVRLAKIGAFDYEGRRGLFNWSDEMRAIVGIDTDRTGRERERMIARVLVPAIEESLNTRKPLDLEFTLPQPNGDLKHLHAVGDVEDDGHFLRLTGIMRDVTEDKEALRRLTHIANHDALTELPNRRFFQEKIEQALRKRNARGALLTIDIDRFKDLNDSGGHDVGDMLLRDFGRRLMEAAGNAFVARLGGDEFAVLLPVGDRMEAEHVARLLIAELCGPLVVFGRSTSVQVSAGLTMYPEDGSDATDLLKNADQALYQAKARGRNMLVTYTADIRKARDERMRVCAEVRQALPEKQFVPFYQPKIRLDTGEVAGFEALIRWDHPSGIKAPGYFSAALEEPELSRQLCAAMLDRILADMARWQARDLPFGRIAFNASSSEFSDFDLAGHLTWRLQAIGIAPTRIGVEVTEQVFLDGDSDFIVATLARLRKAGVETALDDFGTGFASLTHLQDFPIDVIKIDQTFISRLTTDAASRAITTAVLSLGHSLGKTVVAEGVESAEQALLLKAARCDEVQGFYFGRPMPGSHVPKFLETWQTTEQVQALKRSAA